MTTIKIRGQMSTSLDIDAALGFAAMNKKDDTNPVLLITTIQNYTADSICAPKIFLLDNSAYSAYSSECECLVQDGAKVHIMKVEKAYSKTKKQVFTIIHLYHNGLI